MGAILALWTLAWAFGCANPFAVTLPCSFLLVRNGDTVYVVVDSLACPKEKP